MRRAVNLLLLLVIALATFTETPASRATGADVPSFLGPGSSATETADRDELVAYNTKSGKYHCLTCSAAKRCTRNCIELRKSVAKARGGVACKICGGSCG